MNNNNYKIFSYNNKGNLLVGHLEIKDYNSLFKLYKILLRDMSVNSENRDKLMECYNLSSVKINDFKYKSNFVNISLILNSLFSDLNKNVVIKRRVFDEFLYESHSINEVWDFCANGLVNSMNSNDDKKKLEYELFSLLIGEWNCLEYVIDDVIDLNCVISLKDGKIITKDKFYSFDCNTNFFNQLRCNSLIFNTCNGKIRSKIKSRFNKNK